MGMKIDGKLVKFIRGRRIKLDNRRVTIEEFTGNHFRLGWQGLKDRKKRIIFTGGVILSQKALEATCSLIFDALEKQEKESGEDA